MKDTRECVENRQLHKGGCLHENRVELEDNAGALSISSTSGKDANDGKVTPWGCLYKCLTARYVRWCERPVGEIIIYLLLD
ncbi:hypothetical protein [Clostridium thermosuccinogenes]|uniref:hypothetical protein n=1 Tax=Clostridium thermosuccinogenes TaxID=84032 RepID=UPI000CCC6135|nr:hypothetical protein [Pseudoclostridium thermosuccinogenes]PNT92374.1 hypothetical protein CDQ83_01995 [Pseudoclostridium thermosuccinogenes]